jgi:hypothetical protein
MTYEERRQGVPAGVAQALPAAKEMGV